jgi:hypothetical protein
MKIEDAAKILDITGELTQAIIKKAYRKACSKYHPDKGGSLKMMQAVNEAYESLKDFEGSVDAGCEGYADSLNEAINKIVDLPGVEIEVCGAWVWVTGETKTHKEILKEANFWWAKKKAAWYFRPSDWKSAGRGDWSLDRIRDHHGSEKVAKKEQKKVEAA